VLGQRNYVAETNDQSGDVVAMPSGLWRQWRELTDAAEELCGLRG
jgi:hypothetical protein